MMLVLEGELYRSLIENVELVEGTYYIAVDGYGGDFEELTIDYSAARSYNTISDETTQKNLTRHYITRNTKAALFHYTQSYLR